MLTEEIWNGMVQSFGRGNTAALAGIDLALWDIKGKALEVPVWRLLGGCPESGEGLRVVRTGRP